MSNKKNENIPVEVLAKLNDFYFRIGQQFRYIRIARKMEQDEFGRLLGYAGQFAPQNQVSNIEQGSRFLSLKTLFAFAYKLGYKITFKLEKIQPEEARRVSDGSKDADLEKTDKSEFEE